MADCLGEKDLEQLITILKIPEPNHAKARRLIGQMVTTVVDMHNRTGSLETTPKADRAALKRIATAAEKLNRELERLTNGASQVLDQSPLPEPNMLIAALDLLQEIGGTPGKAGRPRSRSSAFMSLIGWLVGIAEQCNGRASINADEQRGRLVDALNLLRDLMPPGLVPNVLPFGTIAKRKDLLSKLRKRFAIKNGTKITRL